MSSASSLFSAEDVKLPKRKEIQVQAHRGGFKPDNLLSSFTKAIQSGIKAIEMDLWLTKDGQLVVMHGGSQGELGDYGLPDKLVWETDLMQIKELDGGNGETIPTLSEVFILLQPTDIFVNLELKGPTDPVLQYKYDSERAT
jgi:glycerophosphoryl diester phosphodiesterase